MNASRGTGADPWWREAVVYQVYVRSFADADGDGIGDLPGIVSRLEYLRDLGVDALWLTPFYTSPQHDHGYDVADPTDVDPLFGTLDDFAALRRRSSELGLRLVVDLVPNHTSIEHPWFRAALAGAPGGPERARYLFRDGRGPGADEPPNNWDSVFGGPAWTRVTEPDGTPGQWYLHLFDASQPDLDWRNPEIGEEYERVLRCWLDRGVDGFRIDVAHGLFKEASLRDQAKEPALREDGTVDLDIAGRPFADEPMWQQPEVHEVYRRWRTILDSSPGERMAVAEAWTRRPEQMAAFIRPDELHQTFNFAWLTARWSASEFADVIERTLAAAPAPTWVLSNHDVDRHPTRYGGGPVGVARARAATLAMLALPGSAYLYQGEELGLEQVDVAPQHRTDPSWHRTGAPGRDGCRVPLPWSGEAPPFGFGPGPGQPWIPQPEDWRGLTAEAQAVDELSTLSFYRRALATRRVHVRGTGPATARAEGDRLRIDRDDVRVLVNTGADAVPVPEGEVLLASGALVGGALPPDTAVWVRRR